MDVKDRAARIDVLTVLAPAARDASSANSELLPSTNGGFASSLQKSQTGSGTRPAATGSKPATAAENPGNIRPSGRGRVDENSSKTPPWSVLRTGAIESAIVAVVGEVDHSAPEAPSDEAGDINLNVLQLLTALAAAHGVPTPDAHSTTFSVPPGLAVAISAVSQRAGNNRDLIPPPAEAPSIPAGLQVALAAWSPDAAEAQLPAAEPTEALNEAPASFVAADGPEAELPNSIGALPPPSSPAAGANSAEPIVTSESQSNVPAISAEKPETHEMPATRIAAHLSAGSIAVVEPARSIAAPAPVQAREAAPSTDNGDVVAAHVSSRPRFVAVQERPILPRPQAAEDLADPAEISAWSPENATRQGGWHSDSLIMQPRTDSIPPAIADQLQPALARAASTQHPLSILLRPPELGAVRIDISQQGAVLTARLEAESPAAHRMLTESLPQLRDVLTPLGVAPDQIQVLRMESPSAWEPGRAADAQADAGSSRQNQDAPPRHSAEPDGIDEPERDDRGTPMVQSRTAINLKI